MKITKDNNINDYFDLTFAYEALARAYSINNDNKAKEYLKLVYESLDQIKNEDDKKYSKSQLDEIKITY